MLNNKTISIFELILVVLSVISFSYFVSTDLPNIFEKENSVIQFLARPIIPTVSASNAVPSGCCKETLTGATCQEMVLNDKSLCKTDLIGTGCEVVSECQKGCCYDADSGMCSLNAPKESCTSNGGKWDESSTCAIPECQVGCCILGDGAAMTTTRECTQMASDYKIEKNFKPLDSQGSCDSYSDLTEEGACLFASDDFSNEKNCIFTTKENCNRANQEFKKGYLCTSKELNTTCEKTTKTSCMDGDDRVYFLDSCGNKANIYDAKKADEDSYWEKIIPASQSCAGSPEVCGNCNYVTGSICTKYFSGRDLIKPAVGDYVCKNLNCVNGKKHGESWCISDSSNLSNIGTAVGTRNYVASCFEGEIRIEGCADFNQEICIENYDNSLAYSEAMCLVNDWRSCIYANDFSDYSAIKKKCDTLPQCAMFNEIEGNEVYKNLPGFKENTANDDQGRAGKVGKGMNLYVMQCMPRFTPGYQFWTTSTTKTSTSSTVSYGGSKSETDSLCGLSTFKCVSHIETTQPMINPTPHDKENPECNWQAVSQSNQQVALMMEGLNEKCRMMGSCGVQYNTQGQLGSDGFSVSRIYIDKKGKPHYNYSITGYSLPSNYLNETLEEEQSAIGFGEIETLSELTLEGESYLSDYGELKDTGIITSPQQGSAINKTTQEATKAVGSAGGNMDGGDIDWSANSIGALAAIGSSMLLVTITATATWTTSTATYVVSQSAGLLSAGSAQAAVSSAAPAGTPVTTSASISFDPSNIVNGLGVAAFSILGSILGSYIGGMIAKSAGMTPGESTAMIGILSAVGSGVAVALTWVFTGLCNNPIGCIVAIIVAVIMLVYSMFTGVDNEYYVTEFKCEAWQPPLVGKCEECNNDVRPCSENKCRSIGNNCRYFVDNGEPGYCATLSDVWAAKIDPWDEKLTSGNKYVNISSSGFKIVNKEQNSKEVDAWKTIKFGIITDKEATCKLDTNHSKKYDEMRYTMLLEKNYETGKVDGLQHWISLSPHVVLGESEIDEGITTPPLEEGENEYYIICQNFAGQTNSVPFIVQVKQAEGPDLTAAEITRATPADKSYIAYNSTNLTMWIYLDEPAECRYSIEYDYNFFEEMPNNFSCLTGKDQGFYGEWPCMAIIPNATKTNKIFIKCKDQPELVETDILTRNKNSVSFQYEYFSCQMGLKITSITPNGIIEANSSQQINLEVKTEGCINNGEAECVYKLPYYGDTYSSFFNTGKTTHIQPLTNLGSGERTVNIECQDKAGNIANASVNFTVFFDDNAPGIVRIFGEGEKLVLETNEEANCAVNVNESKGCDFKIAASNIFITKHAITLTDKARKQTLYIRCEDKKGNTPAACTQIIKLVDFKNED